MPDWRDQADAAVAAICGGPRPAEEAPARKTKRTPHETDRTARQLAVVFPTPEWKEAVLELAAEWNVRTSDFLTWCVSYAMRAVADGKVHRPSNGGAMYHHRAGECMELPWEPE
jgi:hypothetical protein